MFAVVDFPMPIDPVSPRMTITRTPFPLSFQVFD